MVTLWPVMKIRGQARKIAPPMAQPSSLRPERDTDERHRSPLGYNALRDVLGARSQRHPDRDLLRALDDELFQVLDDAGAVQGIGGNVGHGHQQAAFFITQRSRANAQRA